MLTAIALEERRSQTSCGEGEGVAAIEGSFACRIYANLLEKESVRVSRLQIVK
jgi:hypothetical protein